MIEGKILKKDVEGFMSAFNYNQYGSTNVNDVSALIQTRDDEIPFKLAQKKRPNAPPVELNKNLDTSNVSTEQMHNQNIKRLVNEIEDKVFNGKVKLYNVFKQFDKDNDGYVSYDDFEKCLKSIKVQANKEEISSIMKLIDKNDNGYLNFTEFSKTFSPNMSENLVSVPMRDTYHNNLYPSREVNQKNY